jgi:hypothetical protein
LTFGLVGGATSAQAARFDAVAVTAASLIILERIDGPLYVGAVVGSFLLFSDRTRRLELLRRVALPAVCVGVVFHAWRFWYFRTVFPMPVYAKILFKLKPDPQLVTKLPAQSYGLRFVGVYGTVAVGLLFVASLYAAWRERIARPLLLAVGVMAAYPAMVSDWMFGFRLFTPILPLVAVLIALSLSVFSRHLPRIGWLTSIAIVLWCGVCAHAFLHDYEDLQAPSWWRRPSLESRRFFSGYSEVLEVAGQYIQPRTLVAYPQAGFVPFMLDLQNIDFLGLCSKFYAELPSTDVYFTEVGRYFPLTESPSIRAYEAYLLYRDVPFVLASFNSGMAPPQIIDGYYRKIATIRGEGVYARTSRSTAAYRSDPSLFFENLAHVSSLREVRINGRPLEGAAIKARLPFLRDERGWAQLEHGAFVLDAQLADVDATAYRIDLNGIVAAKPVSIVVELISSTGSRHLTTFKTSGGSTAQRLSQRVDGAPVTHLHLTISGDDTEVWLKDLRIQGQSLALAHYIRQSLEFVPPTDFSEDVSSDATTRVR